MEKEKCILLFSGGRDSTVSAIYLAQQYEYLYLTTVKSVHLKGIENVYQRLKELKSFVTGKCTWELYRKIENLPLNSLKVTTCLPCHAYYVALVQNIAVEKNIKNISLGYVGYQNCWEEQSEYAKQELKKYLKSEGLNLILPVENVASKSEIKKILKKFELTEDALEQKCLKSIFNVHLDDSEIKDQVDAWIETIKNTYKLIRDSYSSTIVDNLNL